MNIEDGKKYIKGTKNAGKKKPTLILLKMEQLVFMDLYIKLKKEQGYNRLAFTRADYIDEAISNITTAQIEEFKKNASNELLQEAIDMKIIHPKTKNEKAN